MSSTMSSTMSSSVARPEHVPSENCCDAASLEKSFSRDCWICVGLSGSFPLERNPLSQKKTGKR